MRAGHLDGAYARSHAVPEQAWARNICNREGRSIQTPKGTKHQSDEQDRAELCGRLGDEIDQAAW